MTDVKALKALVRKAHAANVAVDKKTREARILSAEATHAVIVADEIGKGKTWETQGDYATALGVSGGSVTQLKRLGKALALGVDPNGKDWNLLSSKAGSKEFGEAVDADGATPESIVKAVRDVFGDDGRRKETKNSTESGEAAKETKRAPITTVGDIAAILRDVETALHGMSDADQTKVEAAMLKFVAANRKRRETLAAKAEKKTA